MGFVEKLISCRENVNTISLSKEICYLLMVIMYSLRQDDQTYIQVYNNFQVFQTSVNFISELPMMQLKGVTETLTEILIELEHAMKLFFQNPEDMHDSPFSIVAREL